MKAMSRKDSGISCMSGNLSTTPYDNIQHSDRLQGSTKSNGMYWPPAFCLPASSRHDTPRPHSLWVPPRMITYNIVTDCKGPLSLMVRVHQCPLTFLLAPLIAPAYLHPPFLWVPPRMITYNIVTDCKGPPSLRMVGRFTVTAILWIKVPDPLISFWLYMRRLLPPELNPEV